VKQHLITNIYKEVRMKLRELKLNCFRGYNEETILDFEDLTLLIGRNDAGKSTILDALDIFFNDAKIEKDDSCVFGDPKQVQIACVFDELPESIIIDEAYPTSLKKEYLVREDGCLEICKSYDCTLTRPKAGVSAKAFHPSGEKYSDLLTLKISDLKNRAKELDVNLDNTTKTISSAIRQAIWSHEDQILSNKDINLASETGKKVWEQIQKNLPVFALFKSDRASTDQDAEAQDPMKIAVKEVIKKHETELSALVGRVEEELKQVSARTIEKIHEMNPELAQQLIPQVTTKSWDTLFGISLTGEDEIPINKRGSGIRRLILLNFFRAKAEGDSITKNAGVIYAIEEPETSQHPNYQLMLLEAFEDLINREQCQIILTTHTPNLARKVNQNYLRLIVQEEGKPVIYHGKEEDTLSRIVATLGAMPDHDIKVFFGVEGKNDINFFKNLSKILHQEENEIPDLELAEQSGHLVFIPLGGSNMDLWLSRLTKLSRPEFYFTDRDIEPPASPKYQKMIDAWNNQDKCTATCTTKKELENYIHTACIRKIAPTFPEVIGAFDDVPELLAEHLHNANPDALTQWDKLCDKKKAKKVSAAKRKLNEECVLDMNKTYLSEVDKGIELISWLKKIGKHLA
jgi:hypothetical protein